MTDIVDLARRFARKADTMKGMQLAPEDLALLVAIGVNDVIQSAAADFLREQCQQRVARSRSISAGPIASSRGPAEPMRSSGTTNSESANEAAARALHALKRPARH